MAVNKNLADTINIYAANYKVLVVTGGDTSAADPSVVIVHSPPLG
jgi:hypothetical protein